MIRMKGLIFQSGEIMRCVVSHTHLPDDPHKELVKELSSDGTQLEGIAQQSKQSPGKESSPEGRRWDIKKRRARMRGKELPFLYPSPAAHLVMGVTLSRRERENRRPRLQGNPAPLSHAAIASRICKRSFGC